MKLQLFPVTFGGGGEPGDPDGSWWYAIATIVLAVFAQLLIPDLTLLSADAYDAVAVVSIVAFFGPSFLLRQPRRYLEFRTIGLCLITSGIFASPNFVPGFVELVAIAVPKKRSHAVSSALLLSGLVALSAYWLCNICGYLKNRRISR